MNCAVIADSIHVDPCFFQLTSISFTLILGP